MFQVVISWNKFDFDLVNEQRFELVVIESPEKAAIMAASALADKEPPADLESLLKEIRSLKLKVEEERQKITDVTR